LSINIGKWHRIEIYVDVKKTKKPSCC